MFKSRRYSPDSSGFVGRDLSPKGYVEQWEVGDYNLNGAVDAADVDALCQGLASGDRIYDVNFDDRLDAADAQFMVTDILDLMMGDANLDGLVDGVDFLAWNANKFQVSNRWSEGDFNCNGVVDGADFLIWNSNKFNAPFMLPTDSTVAGPGSRIDAKGADSSEPLTNEAIIQLPPLKREQRSFGVAKVIHATNQEGRLKDAHRHKAFPSLPSLLPGNFET